MRRPSSLTALFVAKLISTFGSWLTVLALPWFVLVTTGSPARMSLVLTAEFLGVALLGLPSAQLVARWGTRRTMLVGDAARVPLMALVPLLHQMDQLSLPALLTISFGLGIFTTPYVSSQRLILPELLDSTDEKSLARANSLIDGATRFAALAGPAAGGLLIAALGPAEVLWVDAGTYLVSYVIVLLFVRPTGGPPAVAASTSAFTGITEVLRNPALRPFVLALTAITAAFPAIFTCLPVLVLHTLHGGPRTLGLLTAANGVGLAVGSLIAVTTLSRLSRPVLILATAVQSLPLFLLLLGNVPATATGLLLSGLATPLLAATLYTRFTLNAPPGLRPHVLTAVTTAENLAAFAGVTATGPLLQISEPRPVLAGVATLATIGAALYTAALRTEGTSDPDSTPETRQRTTPEPNTLREPAPDATLDALREPASGTPGSKGTPHAEREPAPDAASRHPA